jgi:PKD repeat protein
VVLSEKRNILYKSIGGKSTENGELELLYIPKEAVPGEYTVELNWSFYVGSEKYTKTNKIKVNVVS